MDLVVRAKEVFQIEIDELRRVSDCIGSEVSDVVELIYSNSGKVVITGIGKTGTIGKKIASSMASTGTQAIFINAAEAMHGDLGMISRGDVVIVISNSGESDEITNVVQAIKKLDCPLVAMTGNIHSTLAQNANFVINVSVSREACKIGLAPTTSTTAALVMGDALTVCLMEKRDFQPENFALYHPGGALGRRMLTQVKDLMTNVVPMVTESTLFKDVIAEVSLNKLGITMVADADGVVTGIITDGDIRRAAQHYDNFQSLQAVDFMNVGFKRIEANTMVNDALELMDRYKITTLAVVQHEKEPNSPIVGILHIHHVYGFTKQK